VADVEGRRVTGFWLRHQPAGGLPLARRDPPPDSRWQRGAVVDALYLADSEASVWAEWYRHLAELGLPPAMAMPRDLWRWRVDAEVADLSGAERLGELSAIVDRLPRVMRVDYIPVWLLKPVEALGDDKPVDLIARGEYRRVARVIAELEEPGAS